MKERIRQRLIERESFLPFGSVRFDTKDTSLDYQTDIQKMFESLKQKAAESKAESAQPDLNLPERAIAKTFFDAIASCMTDIETDSEHTAAEDNDESSDYEDDEVEIEIEPLVRLPTFDMSVFHSHESEVATDAESTVSYVPAAAPVRIVFDRTELPKEKEVDTEATEPDNFGPKSPLSPKSPKTPDPKPVIKPADDKQIEEGELPPDPIPLPKDVPTDQPTEKVEKSKSQESRRKRHQTVTKTSPKESSKSKRKRGATHQWEEAPVTITIPSPPHPQPASNPVAFGSAATFRDYDPMNLFRNRKAINPEPVPPVRRSDKEPSDRHHVRDRRHSACDYPDKRRHSHDQDRPDPQSKRTRHDDYDPERPTRRDKREERDKRERDKRERHRRQSVDSTIKPSKKSKIRSRKSEKDPGSDEDPLLEITAVTKGKNMTDLKQRMLERMRRRSITPLADAIGADSKLTRTIKITSDTEEDSTARLISKSLTDSKTLNEKIDIEKSSHSLRKMKKRLLQKKEVYHANSDDDESSIAQSEFSIATNVCVERGLSRLVNDK